MAQSVELSTQSKAKSNSKFFYLSLWAVALIIIVKDFATGYPFNSSFAIRYLDDAVILALYLWLAIDALKTRKKDKITAFYFNIFLIFAILHLAQSVVIGRPTNAAYYFLFIRDNFWYFPVFYFTLKYLSEKQVYRVIYAFLLTQLFAVSVQVLYHFLTAGSLLWEDDINGTLGANSSHILSYSLLLIIPVLIQKNLKRLILLSIFVILLASARSALIISSLTFLSCYTLYNLNYKKILIAFSACLLILIPAYKFINNNSAATLDPTILLSQQSSELKEGVGAARLSFLIYSASKIDSLEKFFFGYGSGSYSSRTATVLGGEQLTELNKNFRFNNEFISGGSSYNAWIVEHGYIAFFLILLAFIYPAFSLRNQWPTFAGFLIVFFGLSVQKLMESYSFGFLFWLIYAYFIIKKNQLKEQHKKAQHTPTP